MDPYQPRGLLVLVLDNNENEHHLVVKIKDSGIRLGFQICYSPYDPEYLLNLSASPFFNLRCKKIITSIS